MRYRQIGATTSTFIAIIVLGALFLGLGWLAGRAEADLSMDGTNDEVIASSGTIGLGDEHLVTTGNGTFNNITLTGANCSGHANGGALTTDGSGNVLCSDDDGGGGGGSGPLWSYFCQQAFRPLANETRFCMNGGAGTVETDRVMVMTRAGSFQNLFANATVAMAADSTVKVFLRVNGADKTALEVTLDDTDGTTPDSDTVGSVAVSQGDKVSIALKETEGTSPGSLNFQVAVEFY